MLVDLTLEPHLIQKARQMSLNNLGSGAFKNPICHLHTCEGKKQKKTKEL